MTALMAGLVGRLRVLSERKKNAYGYTCVFMFYAI